MSLLRAFLPKSSFRTLRITPAITRLPFRQFSTTPLSRTFVDGSSKNILYGHKTSSVQENNPSALFSNLDVVGSIPPPASSIEAVYGDGFLFQNGVKVRGGDGVLLVNNEVFRWRPATNGSEMERKGKTGLLELDEEVWGLLDVVHPKPDLGISVDAMDTRNAAAEYNLLSTERMGGQVAAALMVESFAI